MTKPLSLFDDPLIYPARSLYQPWAGAVVLCGYGYRAKPRETRPQDTRLRGPFVLCAGMKVDRRAEQVRPAMRRLLVDERGVPPDLFDELTNLRGMALGLATITGSRLHIEADLPYSLLLDAYVPGEKRYVYELADVQPFDPFVASGRQGWFAVSREKADRAASAWLARAFVRGMQEDR